LDSDEMENPPSKFTQVFEMARALGFRTVGHGGHDGPPRPYVSELLTHLKVERIDHGVRVVEDEHLMKEVKSRGIPFTVCPVSNVKIGPYPSLSLHPLRTMFDYGLRVSVNSDDPAYLMTYISDVFIAVGKECQFSCQEMEMLCRNAVSASFMSDQERVRVTAAIDAFLLSGP